LLTVFVIFVAIMQAEDGSHTKMERSAHITQRPLRVMTFNIWLSGRRVVNGIEKIVKHILINDPDVVAMQEVYPGALENITQLLGPRWTGVEHSNDTYPDVAFLTKHKFLVEEQAETYWAMGIPLQIDDQVINLWNLHLYHLSNGPYAAFNKLVTNASQIMAGEKSTLGGCERGRPQPYCGRVQNVEEVLNHTSFNLALSAADERPLIVVGDFNSPSHLDWTERTKDIHGGWAFEWPATKILQEYANLTDSYREVFPDEVMHPGITWSTVNKFYGPEWDWTIPEPQDRIDFIFYRSAKLSVKNSFTYAGTEPLQIMPHQWDNDYPSDHYAVITDFELRI
jgi:endonuclease/exonuclease/phosphatase (EEP) superfamily protein YafD